MLVFTTWHWGDKYSPLYAQRLVNSVKRNLKQSHRFAVISEDARINVNGAESWAITDLDLLKAPGCVVRMRLFDPTWQAAHAINQEDRIVSMDVDMIITGELDPLFDRPDDFCILQHINTTNPCPYNGSIFMFKARYRPDVWNDFSLEANSKVPFHAFPDDQGWMHHKIPNGGAWGPKDGVYGFKKRGWHSNDGDQLPKNARIVAFPGWRDPKNLTHVDWVVKHWR